MNPEARAVVDLVAGGTPVCNADMPDLHPDMSSAAAEIYASRIALAEFLHVTYVNEEMGFGKIKPINILVDNSTGITETSRRRNEDGKTLSNDSVVDIPSFEYEHNCNLCPQADKSNQGKEEEITGVPASGQIEQQLETQQSDKHFL